ncbi:MAG: DUF177 domain-containing protein [Polyangiaceae bacterium]|nr:DUF177 domain-containing protein [Polyangiaceae bacterium]
MSKPLLVVPIADLEQGPKSVEWELGEGWLSRALEGTDAKPVGAGRVEARLTKTGKEVLVQGRAEAKVTVPDARTLEPVEVTLEGEICLMLAPAPTSVGPKRGRQPRKGAEKPAHKPPSRGFAQDAELSAEEAGRDTYSGDDVVLDGFVREFLLLELPMVAHKDLPADHAPGIAPPPAPDPETEGRVDPRLAPLAAIAERLRERKN